MKTLPIAIALSCALLIGCNRPATSSSDAQKQEQERLADEQQAQIISALHEREAALDEQRERLLDQRTQLTVSASPAEQPAQPQPTPPPPAATPIPTPAADTSYQAFYDNLSPYGAWVQMPGYDYVWQPAAALQDPRWRPYTLGHFVFTDAGWTWLSDEPFGWITYHYGRWMLTHTLGWVWVPGDLWAPAWVSWRYGNNFVGWAPLPPEARFDGTTAIQQWADDQYDLGASDYVFVPASEFGDDSMADAEVPPDEVDSIYDGSNNETNIYYDTSAYVIVCYGPNYDFMRSKSRIPLSPPLTLSRTGFLAGGNNHAAISGNSLKVAAPRIVRPRSAPAPKSVRGSVADTRVIPVKTTASTLDANPQPSYQPPQASRATQPQSVPEPRPRVSISDLPGTIPPAESRPPSVPETRPAAPGAGEPPAPNSATLRAAPAASDADAQRAHDLQIIQQQQEASEREHQAEAAEAAEQQRLAEQQRAIEAARAERAVEETQAARAAAEQQAVRQESARTAQPAGVPANPQAPVTGRAQQ